MCSVQSKGSDKGGSSSRCLCSTPACFSLLRSDGAFLQPDSGALCSRKTLVHCALAGVHSVLYLRVLWCSGLCSIWGHGVMCCIMGLWSTVQYQGTLAQCALSLSIMRLYGACVVLRNTKIHSSLIRESPSSWPIVKTARTATAVQIYKDLREKYENKFWQIQRLIGDKYHSTLRSG